MNFFFHKIFLSIILISLFSLSLSDNEKVLKTIQLNEIIKGKMDQNESREYYELKLPKEIPPKSLLIFTVKESRKGVKEGDELFSDPDIYVSKTTKFPSNKEEADWYSERYGSDILTIPSYAVDKEEIFYICMYCQYKCRYQLNSYLSKEVPAILGKYYTFSLTKKSSINYALFVPENQNKEELNVIANNPSLKNFRIFMATESPSSQNTFQIIPSWNGGYVIPVSKFNKHYCTNCTYHILFQTEEERIDIQFTAYFQSTLTQIKSGNPINDAVKGGSKRCYYFDTSNTDNLYNSKLIISVNLFSGSIILSLNGWKYNPENKENTFKIRDLPYNYHIENDKIIVLKKEDFEYFDKNGYDSEYGEEKKLHFCLSGQQMTSYSLNIYFLSDAQSLQRFNFISPGSELTAYLQGGQLTTYRILDFNLNKNSIITLSFTSLEGKVEFFSTFCTNICKFDDELLKERLESGDAILATDVSNQKKNIVIKPEDNKCYKDNLVNQVNKCKTLAVIKCFENADDICSFKIFPTINDQSIFMSPKKTYYNIIPKGKIDLYEIVVNDEEVNSIVIVLTSVTGDAELEVNKSSEKDEKSNFLGRISRNKNYIPDVVRITPINVGNKNVIGKYLIKVSASSFSSYNLYYYTTRVKSKDEQPNLKDITLSLSEGNIIKDYFPNDIAFKIFSYTPQTKMKEDIKIVLTRINVHFSFKVYLDFSKIKYNYDIESKYQERLTNYDWASDHNNELTIYKNDKKYSEDGPYYIVVTRDNSFQDDENAELEISSLMMYYLGVSKRGIPFTLNEGIEHSETINEKYDYQDYFYVHKDINNPFSLEVNILNGEVDVFIDTKELKYENITSIYNIFDKKAKNENINEEEHNLIKSPYIRSGIKDYASIELYKGFFEQKCLKKETTGTEDKTCYLYIYVIQSIQSRKYLRDSQYIINAKSSLNIGNILLSGKVYNAKSKYNMTDHYIIEEVKHRKGISINVKFKNGGGEIYVKIPKIPEIGKNITYPNETYYDYKGVDTYMGKVVTIPPKVFDRINSNSLKLQMLISIFPKVEVGEFSNVEYSITYGSEPKRISQNIPYQSFLTAGEHHYFTFYFDESTENIYISLSNMNGDADMYLNYGNENMPSIIHFDWSSTNLGHEYIDINAKDKFFKKNRMKNIAGYYTLLVIGFTETTYTLYVSSHPDKIIPLYDNSPINCRCQIKGEKCYFRYNNVFTNENSDQTNNIKKTEIIFTTQYIYGYGKMYASVYKDQELINEVNKKYQEFFPTEDSFQFSNSVTGKRNYLKVKIENEYYMKDSLVLLTYICEEKTDVEITAASLQYNPLYSYIDPNRENMYYIKYNEFLSYEKQLESIINFYASNDESLIYELHAYTGKARIRIYTNQSIYNENYELIRHDYNHIAEFNIRAEYDEENTNLNTFTENYFNIINNNLIFNKNVYFNIKPMSDFGFYIQVTYDRTWVNIPVGESKSYLVNKNFMAGYFDINNEYSNVEMSLSLDEYTQKRAIIYIKVIVLSKDAKKVSPLNEEDKLYHYEIPSYSNYDYKGKTNGILGALNININNLPILKDNDINNKFIRALFSIEIKRFRNRRRPKQTSEASDNLNILNNNNQDINLLSPTSKITISVIAGINNFKRIDLPQHTYYFSNTSLIPSSPSNFGNNINEYKQYDGNKEVKIYSLDKRSNEDRKMIIHLHSCSGEFDLKLSKKIIDYDNNPNDVPLLSNTDEYGRSKYLVDNLKDKHLYLSIKSVQLPQDCNSGKEKDANNVQCSKELSYLLYYYTLTEYEYSTKKQDLILKYKYEKGKFSEFQLVVTPLGGKDRFNNIRKQNDIEYNLFWTNNKTLIDKLDNICYLSQILNKNDSNKFTELFNGNIINVVRDIKLNEKNEYSIINIGEEKYIYVNILARNLKTNELIAYIPLSGIINKSSIGVKYVFLSLLLLCIFIFISYLFYKYYIERRVYGYEEIKNSKVVTEMGSVNSNKIGYQRISL